MASKPTTPTARHSLSRLLRLNCHREAPQGAVAISKHPPLPRGRGFSIYLYTMSENLVHTVCTDGFEMEYAQFGNGPRPLVVIPGLAIKSVMKSADALQVPYKAFTTNYTLYFFDRRKNVAPGYSVEDMARDQALVLQALGISDAALYGVSQGGMVAQHIAANYPELVWKLVLGCSTSKAEPQQLKVIGEWTRKAREHDGTGLVSAFIRDCFSASFAARYFSYSVWLWDESI